jgi:hypothetical protein
MKASNCYIVTAIIIFSSCASDSLGPNFKVFFCRVPLGSNPETRLTVASFPKKRPLLRTTCLITTLGSATASFGELLHSDRARYQ